MSSKRIVGLSMAVIIALIAVTAFMADQIGTTDASGGGPQVSLTVSSGGTCEDTKCTVEPGAAFQLDVVIDEIPASGYVLAQSWVNFGTDLTYKPLEAQADEVLWEDCEGAVAVRSFWSGADEVDDPAMAEAVNHGCLSGLLPPLPVSMYTGTYATLAMNCSAEESSTEVTLVGAGTPPANTNGVQFTEGDGTTQTTPKLVNVTINCGAGTPTTPQPTPTMGDDTPTATPEEPTDTPTAEMPTPTPSDQPCGDVDGDGDVDSIDALWDLWVTAGLVEESELEKDGDINGDGDITSIDAALILQISAGLYSC